MEIATAEEIIAAPGYGHLVIDTGKVELALRNLPESIYWAMDELRMGARPAASVVQLRWKEDKEFKKASKAEQARILATRAAPRGGSSLGGFVDVPMGAKWAGVAPRWNESPYDDDSLYLQLNLADIPEVARKPEWPKQGVLWVTLCVAGRYRVETYFDPRAAEDIQWMPRIVFFEGSQYDRLDFRALDTMPGLTGVAAIDNDYSSGGMLDEYEKWASEHFGARDADIQIGGCPHPIQGDSEDLDVDFFMAIERQAFGDSGALYLRYSPEAGFTGFASTH